MIDPPQIIGPRLRRLREHIGLSQAKMAESLGITQPQWSQYESGSRKLTIEVAGTIATRYSVTLDWMYRGDPSGLPLRLAPLLAA